jgi:ParB family chromosome partitioning protein
MAKKFKLPTDKLRDLQKRAASPQDLYPAMESVVELRLDMLDAAPWNARRHFDEQALHRLALDIQRHGLIHPITARPKGEGRFEVVAGERRYRACKLLGLATIKAHIRPLDDATAHQLSLLENLHREDLNPYEETVGYLQLLALKLKDFDFFKQLRAESDSDQAAVIKILNRLWNETKRLKYRPGTNNVISPKIAETPMEAIITSVFEELGKFTWESFFQNRLPILRLPDDLLQALYEGQLPYTKARLLSKIEDQAARMALTRETVDKQLSIFKLRKRIAAHVPCQEEECSTRLARIAKRIAQKKLNQQQQKKLQQLLLQLEQLAGAD